MTLILLTVRTSDVPGPHVSSSQTPCADCRLPVWLELRHALDLDCQAVVLCTRCIAVRSDLLLAACGEPSTNHSTTPEEVRS